MTPSGNRKSFSRIWLRGRDDILRVRSHACRLDVRTSKGNSAKHYKYLLHIGGTGGLFDAMPT
jgi:hypothetical protein